MISVRACEIPIRSKYGRSEIRSIWASISVSMSISILSVTLGSEIDLDVDLFDAGLGAARGPVESRS